MSTVEFTLTLMLTGIFRLNISEYPDSDHHAFIGSYGVADQIETR